MGGPGRWVELEGLFGPGSGVTVGAEAMHHRSSGGSRPGMRRGSNAELWSVTIRVANVMHFRLAAEFVRGKEVGAGICLWEHRWLLKNGRGVQITNGMSAAGLSASKSWK